MIRAVVFDCFGVLAEDGWLPFKRKYIGDNIELAEQVADLGKQNEYGIITNDEYFAQAASLIGVDQQLLRNAVGRRVPNVELFLYIQEFLKPRHKIGLLSNANYDVIHELFSEEQAHIFDAHVLSYEAKLVKPDPKMFSLMAQRLDVELDEYIFIDDVERYCVEAESYGISTILYKDFEQVKVQLEAMLKR